MRMKVFDFLRAWPPYLPSSEGKQALASNSEKRRWIERGSLTVDGEKATLDTLIYEDSRVVLHPNSDKKRTTLQ